MLEVGRLLEDWGGRTGVVQLLKRGVLEGSGLGACGSAVSQVTRGSWKLDSNFGVWKGLSPKVADVGVMRGVGGSPLG